MSDSIDSCGCCFSPDVYKERVSQRGLLESVMSLESESQFFMSRVKPCSPLRKSCSKTSDCCTGYCSVSEDREGFCHDPLILRDHGTRSPAFAELMEFSSMKKSRGQQHRSTSSSDTHVSLASNLSPSSTTRVVGSNMGVNSDNSEKSDNKSSSSSL